jgi:hypothetical protein
MLIKVKAFPNSKEEKIVNKRIIELIADYFNVPQHKAKMIKGFKESSKIFDIKD